MEQLARESLRLSAKPAAHADGPGLGSCGAVFIMLKSAMGAGLLNFPWAFATAGGIHSAVTVELISLIFLISGLVILGYSASISGQCTYQAVVQHVCGKVIGKLCEICFFFNIFMVSVAYLVVLADQLEKLRVSIYEQITGLPENELPYHWYTDQRFTLLILCLLLILPLSVPKEISFQKYNSVLGTLAAVYLTIAIIIKYYIRVMHEDLVTPLYSSGLKSWTSMFSVIPTICFAFQCHEASIAIYSSLENKKLSHWVLISVGSMLFCLVIYSLTGIYGYLTFGKNVTADVLMSYSGDDIPMIIARLLFGLSIITIYPIVLLLGRSVIQDPLLRYRGNHVLVTKFFETCTRVALTVTWTFTSLLIAIFVPDISTVINLTGGISTCFIFIFPGYLHLLTDDDLHYKDTAIVGESRLCLISAVHSQPVSAKLRLLLIVWGIITLLCGTFIFGQSTAIAILQTLNKL